MRPSLTGLLAGIALGFAAAFGGWDALVIVALLTAVGYLVGRMVQRDIDLSPFLFGRQGARRSAEESDPWRR